MTCREPGHSAWCCCDTGESPPIWDVPTPVDGDSLVSGRASHSLAVEKGFYDKQQRLMESLAAEPVNRDHANRIWIMSRLMLIVTEVAEAAETVRKDCAMLPCELADIYLRLADLAYACGIDLPAEVKKKHALNQVRKHMHGKVL